MFLFMVDICYQFGKRLTEKMMSYIFKGPFSAAKTIGPSSFILFAGILQALNIGGSL